MIGRRWAGHLDLSRLELSGWGRMMGTKQHRDDCVCLLGRSRSDLTLLGDRFSLYSLDWPG